MARTITVDDDGPADYSSIREAVEAASEGDTVLVKAGTYHEADIRMKNGTVLQGVGADSTIIVNDFLPKVMGTTFTVIFDEVSSAKIDGFTISGPAEGTKWWEGQWERKPPSWWGIKRGICIYSCSPTIIHNKIINFAHGISILFDGSAMQPQPVIDGNTITNNIWAVEAYSRDVPWDSIDPWDIRWNWWGTTDESEIAATTVVSVPHIYSPWLTEPVTTFQQTPGIHYNNIYNNGFNFNRRPPEAVEGFSWGQVKRRFK